MMKAQKHRFYICKSTSRLQIPSPKFKFPLVLLFFENILNLRFKRIMNKYKVNIMGFFAAFFKTLC